VTQIWRHLLTDINQSWCVCRTRRGKYSKDFPGRQKRLFVCKKSSKFQVPEYYKIDKYATLRGVHVIVQMNWTYRTYVMLSEVKLQFSVSAKTAKILKTERAVQIAKADTKRLREIWKKRKSSTMEQVLEVISFLPEHTRLVTPLQGVFSICLEVHVEAHPIQRKTSENKRFMIIQDRLIVVCVSTLIRRVHNI